MLLSHLFDGGVLIVRLHEGLDVGTRGAAVWEFEALLGSYRPRTVVMELPPAAGAAVVSTVLRAERLCRAAGASLAVVARHLSEAQGALRSHGLEVHATASQAIQSVESLRSGADQDAAAA
ncbi:hypothetical protein ACFWB1_11730 [Streptomyces goshikiensis]|uniref:hypothetical protein n=1 Tax=Streptomyces TaxID=1883 RepID=UPI000F3AA359|nr:hypothetical protein [Streptomyces sp. ADI95-16]AYV25968.1 hypothetical protein EES41_04495 [Streptomyces sp. ADI95-16]